MCCKCKDASCQNVPLEENVKIISTVTTDVSETLRSCNGESLMVNLGDKLVCHTRQQKQPTVRAVSLCKSRSKQRQKGRVTAPASE